MVKKKEAEGTEVIRRGGRRKKMSYDCKNRRNKKTRRNKKRNKKYKEKEGEAKDEKKKGK